MATGYVPAMGGRHKGVLTGLALVCLAVNTCAAKAKPDFTGVWKLRSTRARYSEIWTIKQTARDIRIRMDITDDQLGDRVLDFQAPLDGTERKQTVIGTPASVKAGWKGETLLLEIKRQARPDLLLHNRRLLRLAGEGKRIDSQTKQESPPPVAERLEIFDRQ